MAKKVKDMTIDEIVVVLSNEDNDLSRAGLPPYVQVNTEMARKKIADYLDDDAALMEYASRGRYCMSDKYIIFDNDGELVFTFTTKEDLLNHMPMAALQELVNISEDEPSTEEKWPSPGALIRTIDNTFAKDDIHSIDRKRLESLVLYLYDSLNRLNGTYPDWWDRES